MQAITVYKIADITGREEHRKSVKTIILPVCYPSCDDFVFSSSSIGPLFAMAIYTLLLHCVIFYSE